MSRFSDKIGHMNRLATLIQDRLDAEERSQAWLASRLGISKNTIGSRLKGRTPFSVDELLIAAPALGLDPIEVIALLAESSHAATESRKRPAAA